MNREVTGVERERLIEAAPAMPSLHLSAREISDLELIAIGAFSPLEGFLSEANYRSVRANMRLANGTAWSIPITLSVTEDQAREMRGPRCGSISKR
ncbi:MAG: hypothetical protein WKF84_03500 [Pyrinomonadaceae bacterium]